MRAGLPGPIICLVTDRRRLAGPSEDVLLRLAAAAAAAGVRLIQIREPDLDDRRLLALTRRVVAAVEHTTAEVLVNERVDIALAAGARGVHLRSDSAPPARVRAIVPPGFRVGRSVHGTAEAAAVSGDVDYLVMGTIFRTASKPAAHPLAGLDGLRAVCRAAATPVLAIGGISTDNVDEIAAAGAAGFAAIGLFADIANTTPAPRLDDELARTVTTLRERWTATRPLGDGRSDPG